LPVGGDEGDVAEEFGDLSGLPVPFRLVLQQGQDAGRAAAGLAGAGVLGDGGRRQ
jgi:hypothetical protein